MNRSGHFDFPKLYNRLFISFALPVVLLFNCIVDIRINLFETSNGVNSSLQITKLHSVDVSVCVCVVGVGAGISGV